MGILITSVLLLLLTATCIKQVRIPNLDRFDLTFHDLTIVKDYFFGVSGFMGPTGMTSAGGITCVWKNPVHSERLKIFRLKLQKMLQSATRFILWNQTELSVLF